LLVFSSYTPNSNIQKSHVIIHKTLKWFNNMSTIHTNSIREELERIKKEFSAESAAGEVPASSAMLIKSLIMLLEMVFSIFLEKTTKKPIETRANHLHKPEQIKHQLAQTPEEKQKNC